MRLVARTFLATTVRLIIVSLTNSPFQLASFQIPKHHLYYLRALEKNGLIAYCKAHARWNRLQLCMSTSSNSAVLADRVRCQRWWHQDRYLQVPRGGRAAREHNWQRCACDSSSNRNRGGHTGLFSLSMHIWKGTGCQCSPGFGPSILLHSCQRMSAL